MKACSTFLLQKKIIFLRGQVRSQEEQRGRRGKIMEQSEEIKIGNERNGLLCTKTCKNAPN